ncbi:hypothetical protein LDENG_00008840 [Lucifuga dentata]|nr:hypothetical protein LDENG_00008840 [Lucifuga dentata]
MVCMSEFTPINHRALAEIVQQLKSSTCSLDILPTTFLKGVFSSLTEDLLHIVNHSWLSGIFPTSLKTAVVRPLLKKKNLDAILLNNYRPISNLPFISKVTEKVVVRQIINFLQANNILDSFQSGFCPHHSIETALTKILNDIRLNKDSGSLTGPGLIRPWHSI